MKRLRVHAAVDKLAARLTFYSGLFGAAPVVVKADCAKWMLDDPRRVFI